MARPKKTDGEVKDQRVPIVMAPSELKALDDWMDINRIRSRGEAIRRLCQIAIAIDRPVIFNGALAVSFSKGTDEAFQKLENCLNDPAVNDESKAAQLRATSGWFRRSANHILQYAGIMIAIMQAYRLPGDASEVFRAAKEKADILHSLKDPTDKTFDEIFRSVFPELTRDSEIKDK